jgi:hypothetical protein
VKANKVIIYGCVLALSICGFNALADPPGKDGWKARKAELEYEREQRKRERKWEREEQKHYRELEREERKHRREMAREESKRQEEKWREGDYTLTEPRSQYGVDEPGYEEVDESLEPEYIEDKVHQIIKDLRGLADTLNE